MRQHATTQNTSHVTSNCQTVWITRLWKSQWEATICTNVGLANCFTVMPQSLLVLLSQLETIGKQANAHFHVCLVARFFNFNVWMNENVTSRKCFPSVEWRYHKDRSWSKQEMVGYSGIWWVHSCRRNAPFFRPNFKRSAPALSSWHNPWRSRSSGQSLQPTGIKSTALINHHPND